MRHHTQGLEWDLQGAPSLNLQKERQAGFPVNVMDLK
jgi:hypothetical protein